MTAITIDILNAEPGSLVMAPVGITTPHDSVTSTGVKGARVVNVLMEPELGLGALLLEVQDDSVQIMHQLSPVPDTAAYPESVFTPRRNRFTEASDQLAHASREIAAAAGGGLEGIKALVAEAETRFTYAHPEIRFNDGSEKVPYLSCGLTPGSCIDIHTYLVASLRAAGFEAGYVYGYFFSEERGGQTNDMHCWVITRHNGVVMEWDVAHHMKAGLGPTRSCLNPRPGHRVAFGHSLGHRYTTAQGQPINLKLLAGPLVLSGAATWDKCQFRALSTNT